MSNNTTLPGTGDIVEDIDLGAAKRQVVAISIASAGVGSTTAGGVNQTFRLLSAAASTNATSVSTSPGRIYAIQGYCAASSVRYLKLYNKAGAPTVGTDTPVKTLLLPTAAAFQFQWADIGYNFSVGIALALTGAAADADTTSLVAGDVLTLNVDYA